MDILSDALSCILCEAWNKNDKYDEWRWIQSRSQNLMLSQYIRLILPARCKCTGLKAQRLNLWSRERSIRWTSVWQWSLLLLLFLLLLLHLSDNYHVYFYFYFLHLSSDNDHFYWHHNIQVSFTAKLTVSDKKVKWSFQDQVSTTSVQIKITIHIIELPHLTPM